MSLLRWVKDEARLMRYLSQFDHIIFEGHRSDEEEIACFAHYGFQHEILGKTQIGLSYRDDHYRRLIHFFR